MNMLRSRATVIFFSVVVGAPAMAQVLDEIVVTAHKREESVQIVPLSITAATGDQLEFLNATTRT